MAQVNPSTFSFHLKKDDLEPPLRIKVYDSETAEAFNLTGYTGKFYMALTSDKTTPVVNGVAVNITSATDGEAEYRWVLGDTDVAGEYYFEFRFTSGGRNFSVPLVSPGKVVIETKIGT